MRFLVGRGDGADLGQVAALVDPTAEGPGHRVGLPEGVLGRDGPVLALVAEGVVGPRLDDDLPVLFVELLLELLVGGRVGVAVGERRIVLAEGVDPARLVAASEPGEGATLGHLVEDGDVLGDAQRVVAGQDQAALADAQVLRLHAEEEVEHDRVGRDFLALDMEVVLGERDAVVAVLVEVAGLLGEMAEHVLVEIGTAAGHALFELCLAADGRQVKDADFHALLLPSCAAKNGAAHGRGGDPG